MNIEKIRELIAALAITPAHSERTQFAAEALAELDKAQPAKVLTAERMRELARDFYLNNANGGGGDDAITDYLNFAVVLMDNGYLASAPVDIERIMEVVDQVADFNTWSVPRIQRLRDLLTNALTHKP